MEVQHGRIQLLDPDNARRWWLLHRGLGVGGGENYSYIWTQSIVPCPARDRWGSAIKGLNRYLIERAGGLKGIQRALGVFHQSDEVCAKKNLNFIS